MPSQPPRFRAGIAQPRKPWAQPGAGAARRQRGRAAVAARRRVLEEEPLCRRCLASGLTTAAAEVDHIVPLAAGGSDERANKQALCKPCHETKTRADRRAARHATP